MSRLIIRSAVRAYAMHCASKRHHKFTSVSEEFLQLIEAKTRDTIRRHIESLPSKGKTIR